MTQNELDLLRSSMLQAERYVEYGSGNSTRMAVACPNLALIRSIESDPKFVQENLRNDAEILAAENTGRLEFRFVDLGPTREWGHPQDQSKSHLWPNYALAPYINQIKWDLVLIDGRFRVASALLAALELSSDAIVLVHDFWWRPEYSRMLHFMDIANKADALVQLKRRADFNPQRARDALQLYLYAPDDKVHTPFLQRGVSALSRRSSNLISRMHRPVAPVSTED